MDANLNIDYDWDDGDGVNDEVIVTGLSREIIANLLDFDTI